MKIIKTLSTSKTQVWRMENTCTIQNMAYDKTKKVGNEEDQEALLLNNAIRS